MRKAFDTILQSEVTAEIARENSGFEKYRYECLCCGEEVYLAATFSTKMVVHFKHRNGNNNVECENYYGQFGKIRNDNKIKKSHSERFDFYFDHVNKVFCIGLKFSENEIQYYQERGVSFELRTGESDTPFETIKINTLNFAPEVSTNIPLSKFSFSYYLTNTDNNVRKKYDLFYRKSPTLFKASRCEDVKKAKMVPNTDNIYTNTLYFAIFPKQPVYYKIIDEIEIKDKFSFNTMNRNLDCIILKVLKKTPQSEELINDWGYPLEEASETLTLLWPPGSTNGEVTEINANFAYLYTSFALQAYGNINLHPEDIFPLAGGVSKVAVRDRTKVFRKNTEIVISSTERPSEPYEMINVIEEKATEFTVPDDNTYFIINKSGIIPLTAGQKLILTQQSIIKHYRFGYLDRIILPFIRQELSGKELLVDILKHINITEKYNAACFDFESLSDVAIEYLSECNSTGLINSVAKQYILEGKL